jgi:hypothetical protein
MARRWHLGERPGRFLGLYDPVELDEDDEDSLKPLGRDDSELLRPTDRPDTG